MPLVLWRTCPRVTYFPPNIAGTHTLPSTSLQAPGLMGVLIITTALPYLIVLVSYKAFCLAGLWFWFCRALKGGVPLCFRVFCKKNTQDPLTRKAADMWASLLKTAAVVPFAVSRVLSLVLGCCDRCHCLCRSAMTVSLTLSGAGPMQSWRSMCRTRVSTRCLRRSTLSNNRWPNTPNLHTCTKSLSAAALQPSLISRHCTSRVVCAWYTRVLT